MRTGLAAALIGAAVASGVATGARADYEAKIVGNWMISATEDRFGDGGTFTAVTPDGTIGLVVRCIRKNLSLALVKAGGDPRPYGEGDLFRFRFKVDQGAIVETAGQAISARLIQIDTEKPLVRSIRDGRETAARVETTSGVFSTYVFKTVGGKKAFADLSKECPLD